jgi:hypothetical protein
MSEQIEDCKYRLRDFNPYKGQLEYDLRNDITPENIWFKPGRILGRELLLTAYNTAIFVAEVGCFLKGLELLTNN